MAMQLPTVTTVRFPMHDFDSANIMKDDLRDFHVKHFHSEPQPDQFFQTPEVETEEYYDDYYEDDGLGYYNDAVKRTLTNEQIALFRHTEIQTILRERRRKREAEAEAEAEGPVSCQGVAKDPSPAAISPNPMEMFNQESPPAALDIPKQKAPVSPPEITAARPPDNPGPAKGVQSGRVEKQSQWKTSNEKQKRKNAKNRKVHKKYRKEKRRQRREGSMISGQAEEAEESDEWDPWHQANGPDVQKDTTVDLDY